MPNAQRPMPNSQFPVPNSQFPIMIRCLNPNCPNPHRFNETNVCPSCGVPMVLLRGRYRFIKLLSDRGDANSTYLAQDTYRGNKLCVLKPLGPSFPKEAAQQKAKQQFELEVRCLQDLGEHPQFPRAIAYFEEGGWLHLVQEYLPEATLEEELQKDGCWSESQIRELLLELLPAIAELHGSGCVHGNIKPANIRRRSDRPLPAESLANPKTGESPQFLPKPSGSSSEASLSLSPETESTQFLPKPSDSSPEPFLSLSPETESTQFLPKPQEPEPSPSSLPEGETSCHFPANPELTRLVLSEWSSLLPPEPPEPDPKCRAEWHSPPADTHPECRGEWHSPSADTHPECRGIWHSPPADRFVLIDFASWKPWGPSLQYVLSRTGTKGYAPLEQRRDSQICPNSDLYALGVTCFRLLTKADPTSLLLDRGYNWVARWSKYLPEPISPELERIIDKLLQPKQRRRYQKAEEVLEDLQPSERDTVIATRPAQGQSLWQNLWRRQSLWTFLILGFLGLGIYRVADGGNGLVADVTDGGSGLVADVADGLSLLANNLI